MNEVEIENKKLKERNFALEQLILGKLDAAKKFIADNPDETFIKKVLTKFKGIFKHE